MIYAVYQREDGRLVSITSDATKIASQSVLDARGYSVAELPDGTQNGAWNAATLQFDPRPPEPVMIDPATFYALFTPAERARIYASADPGIVDYTRWLGHVIQPFDLLGPAIAQGLATVAAQGLFDDQNGVADAATSRPAAIQAWRPS
jgi:hypothetical protein